MLRTRVIRPGLVTNEVLAGLGLEAEALFIRLWMLADREGRLEDRPAKIRAEAFPYHAEITAQTVENLLKSLAKAGFIIRYKARIGDDRVASPLICVVNFQKHQWIHGHERASVLPAHPQVGRDKRLKNQNVYTSPDMSGDDRTSPRKSSLVTSNPLLVTNKHLDDDVSAYARDATPPTDPPPSPSPNGKPKRKPPAPTNGVRSEARPAPKAQVDFYPHSADDVANVRASLRELSVLVRLPEPDDLIVRKVLDAGNGASGARIHEVLRGLWHERKFANIRSWGLLPVVVAPWFKTRLAG